MPSYFHKAWLAHVHDEYERGISVTERVKQVRIQNKEHYLDLLSDASGHCFVTNHVYDKWSGRKTAKINDKSPRIFKIYIDLDINPKKGTTFLDAYNDYRILVSWIEGMGIPAQGNFSGKKGFNLYLFTGPKGIRLKRPRLIIGSFISELIKKLGLKTVDRQTTTDLMRITRVVFTKHAASGYYCIPVTRIDEGEKDYHLDSLGEIFAQARLPGKKFVEDHLIMTPGSIFGHGLGAYLEELEEKMLWQDRDLTSELEEQFPTEEYEEPINAKPSFDDNLNAFLQMEEFGVNFTKMKRQIAISNSQSRLFPCLRKAWNKAVNKGEKPDHLVFLALALFYKNCKKMTEEEISRLFLDNFSRHSWYDQDMVDNQLQSIFLADYTYTTSCEKLRMNVPEICLEEKCYIFKKFVIKNR